MYKRQELLWSKERILEVYLNIAEFGDYTFCLLYTSFLAKVIYHELMHYVTPKWSAEKLHDYKGVSLGKAVTNEYALQSETDVNILADHLTKHGQRFWTGAWEAMRTRGYKV